MPLYPLDEFEIEAFTNYSGSYNDNIMSGAFIATGSGLLQNVARVREGSNSSGSAWIFQQAQSQTSVAFSSFFDHQLKYNVGYGFRFNVSSCPSEMFADSILPDIFGVALLNGAKRVFNATPEALPSGAGGVFLPPGGALLNIKAIFGYADVFVTGTNGGITGVQVSDNTWLQTFPFQYRYQAVTRRVGFQTFTVPTDYDEHVSIIGGGPRWDVQYIADPFASPSDPTQFSVEFLSKPTAISATINLDWSGIQHNTLTEFFGTISTATFQLVTTSSYQYSTPPFAHKHVFGFGDGYRGQVLFERVTGSSDSGAAPSYQHGQGAIMRGWKFGVAHGVPTQTKAVWRRNKFGQFRDMLEQRRFTKFYDPIGLKLDGTLGGVVGLTQAAIEVRFISGSNAAITASNPASLNTRESGIYDFEYKANVPFFDNVQSRF